ncbi:helix-turn-helix domain-containing protein [Agrococcus casei]|uniref:helix-turn-helix domain-containing protein n=1 Tax=Agrococcus casei TaxID=343512 RepID=UPI003F8DDAF7
MRSSEQLSIGALASEFGLEAHVLRHWETEGLLNPVTRVGGKRRYDSSARARIGTILAAKEAGMTLASIRSVFSTDSGADRQAILTDQLSLLEQRRRDLELSIAALEHLRVCQNSDFAKCPDFIAIAGAPA